MLKSLLKRLLPPVPDGAAGSGFVSAVDTIALADKLIAEGNRDEDSGELDRACELYRQAAAAAPGHARAHLNLGIALAAKGDGEGAADAYETVLRIDPHHAFGNYNFARLAYMRGDLSRAEALVREALRTKPDFHEALVVLSNVLDAVGRTVLAAEAMEEALRLRPDSLGAWLSQAMLLRKLQRFDDAEVAVKRALGLDPLNVDALKSLSSILCIHGLATEALDSLRKALAAEPNRLDLRSDQLFLLNCDEATEANELFRRHVEWGARLEDAFPPRFDRFLGSEAELRRLRVGYVSGDFCFHPVSLFLIPVLERRSREDFEVFCYSSGSISDRITERLRSMCDHWIEAGRMSDPELAARIHADAIDILIDLTGYTGRPRLPVFCERPAPVQVAWLGYLNTTGLTRMDYRLCDRRTDPIESSQPLHTEKLLPLPNSQWCYRPFLDVEAAGSAPFEKNGYITFGSFNNGIKISPAMCRRWMELLSRVPDSRLIVIGVTSERKQASIKLEMAGFADSEKRIEFLPRVDLKAYLSLFAKVDISLDTFPYGGGTTTFDSLWMGVPVVTAIGQLPVSRSASSILLALGLDKWVAPSIDDYVRVADERASDRQGIALLRRSLRQSLRESPLTDEARFVQDLEHAYREMWMARRNSPLN